MSVSVCSMYCVVCLCISSCIQVIVEVKRFEINISRGHGPVNAELALNGNLYVEVNDITTTVSYQPSHVMLLY